jgi:hypothetical protein
VKGQQEAGHLQAKEKRLRETNLAMSSILDLQQENPSYKKIFHPVGGIL